MTGRIQYISDLMKGSLGDDYYLTTFALDDGSTARSYICPRFRNFKAWKPLLKQGNVVHGLVLKKNGTIDADSPVHG